MFFLLVCWLLISMHMFAYVYIHTYAYVYVCRVGLFAAYPFDKNKQTQKWAIVLVIFCSDVRFVKDFVELERTFFRGGLWGFVILLSSPIISVFCFSFLPPWNIFLLLLYFF